MSYDPNIAIALLLGSFAVFIICKLPITFALISSPMLAMFYMQLPPVAMVQQMAKAIDSFSLMAIPFFILAGNLMNRLQQTSHSRLEVLVDPMQTITVDTDAYVFHSRQDGDQRQLDVIQKTRRLDLFDRLPQG